MNCQQLKVAFAGTPAFAAVALDALLASGHDVVGVLTQPDRPAGRGRKLTPSAVKLSAEAAGVPVQQPLTLRDPQAVEEFKALKADVFVVAAYGLILPQSVLDIPSLGCLNIHASLLPRWRGAAPIHRAILAGDTQTGVCIMKMDAGLDTGDVLLERRVTIGETETTAELHDRLAELGGQALLDVLPAHCAGSLIAQAQPDAGVTYAEKLAKAEAKLNFSESAQQLDRRVRAFNPWPVAEATLLGERVRIWQSRVVDSAQLPGYQVGESTDTSGTIVAISDDGVTVQTGDGLINLLSLQKPGKTAQNAKAFCQGRQLLGERFLIS